MDNKIIFTDNFYNKKILKTDKIEIIKSKWIRGFYVMIPKTQNPAIFNLNFTNYNDEKIEYYDIDWMTTEDGLWNVTKIRGVKSLIMTHTNSN